MAGEAVAVREQDKFLPIANISRIMKESLPHNAKVSKDAKELVQSCVSDFIIYITSQCVSSYTWACSTGHISVKHTAFECIDTLSLHWGHSIGADQAVRRGGETPPGAVALWSNTLHTALQVFVSWHARYALLVPQATDRKQIYVQGK